MLEEFVNWHVSLLHSLLERQQHPDVIVARSNAVILANRLSDLDQHEWPKQRRQCKMKAKQRMDHGAFLVEERDPGKRKFDDMSATEQQTLEDFETKKSRRMYEARCANWLCDCGLDLAACGACGRGWAQTQAQAETRAA